MQFVETRRFSGKFKVLVYAGRTPAGAPKLKVAGTFRAYLPDDHWSVRDRLAELEVERKAQIADELAAGASKLVARADTNYVEQFDAWLAAYRASQATARDNQVLADAPQTLADLARLISQIEIAPEAAQSIRVGLTSVQRALKKAGHPARRQHAS